MAECRKIRYQGPKDARAALYKIWRKARPGRRLETGIYPCPICKAWHLTSKP